MKLIYPDKIITKEEALELIDFAVEGRKRVNYRTGQGETCARQPERNI